MTTSRATRRRISREVARGRSVLRALANDALPALVGSLRGTVLDLGSGEGSGAARREAPGVSRWVGVDLGHRPDVVADATTSLPFCDGAFDGAVSLWFLYIAPDPAAVLREIRRTLCDGAPLVLGVPLVFPVNPEPEDRWRFTGPEIARLLEGAGFKDLRVVALGGRWTSALYLVEPYLRPRRVVARAAVRCALALDAAADRRGLPPNPVAYLAVGIA